MRRILGTGLIAAVAVTGLLVTPSAAAHNSKNKFNLAPTVLAEGANGRGASTYDPDLGAWRSWVRVSGLPSATVFTLYAEAAEASPSQTPICVLKTDAAGRGSCNTKKHYEEALAFARVRLGHGNPVGPVVLEAAASSDRDCEVEDGEIERFPPCSQ